MNSTSYSELYGILLMLGKSYISKLPPEIIKKIENEKNLNYNPEYYSINDIEDKNISNVTLEILSQLYLEYWQNN